MALNVLKDKLGNILNPRIPRYEKHGIYELWSGNQTTTGKINLKDSIRNYDIIAIEISASNTPTIVEKGELHFIRQTMIVSTQMIDLCYMEQASAYITIELYFDTDTSINISNIFKAAFGTGHLTGVYGIKLKNHIS